MPLFLDGARLGYGLAAEGTDVTLADLAPVSYTHLMLSVLRCPKSLQRAALPTNICMSRKMEAQSAAIWLKS